MPTRNPQQLLLVKQLYEDACLLAAREDDLSAMKATLSLDYSVEQMLNTIIMDTPQDGAGRKDTVWKDVWKRAAAVMETSGHDLLNYPQLCTLHEVRNLAQHNGSIPTQGEVKRYIEPVEEMLTAAFRDAYGLDFQTFRLWDLVPNEGLRQLLRDSEYALEKDCPGVSVVGCTQAHNLIIKAIREHTKWRRIRMSQVFSGTMDAHTYVPPQVPHQVHMQIQQAARQLDTEIRRGVSKFRSEIMKEIEFLEDEVVTIGVGMPLMDTRRFQKIGNRLISPIGYSNLSAFAVEEVKGNAEGTREDARFMLTYLSRLARLISEAYSEVITSIKIEKPLTSQNWWKIVDPNVALSTDVQSVTRLQSKAHSKP